MHPPLPSSVCSRCFVAARYTVAIQSDGMAIANIPPFAGTAATLPELCRCGAISAFWGTAIWASSPFLWLAPKGPWVGNVKTDVFRRTESAPSQVEAQARQLEQVLEQIDEAV